LPWHATCDGDARLAINLRAAAIFGTLRDHYDLVLIDAGPVNGRATSQQTPPGGVGEAGVGRGDLTSWGGIVRIDAAYVVAHVRKTSEALRTSRRLKEAGLKVAGLIETFTAAEEAPAAALRVISS
jgi:Mrp family chromosome partitioning ATPase